MIRHRAAGSRLRAPKVIPSFSTIHLILEGVGVMLAVVGLCTSGFVTVALLIRRPREEVGDRKSVV